ncbi:MAG: DUF6390 family protein [Parcubacteria group bacterium]
MLSVSPNNGAVLCSRYAYMPNKLQYCGGDDNLTLFEYATQGVESVRNNGNVSGEKIEGLLQILEEFATLYPYLKLIAGANHLKDIFDRRVAEAYWLGNSLLLGVQKSQLYEHLVEAQELKKKLKPALFEKVVGTIPEGALPHHNFHVISIPKRTGHYPVEHTVETMDSCKISWGQVKQVNDGKVLVEYYPLVHVDGKLTLGEAQDKWCQWQKNESSFVAGIKINDWVTIHWDWVCDRISEMQRRNLRYYTELSINLANSFVI